MSAYRDLEFRILAVGPANYRSAPVRGHGPTSAGDAVPFAVEAIRAAAGAGMVVDVAGMPGPAVFGALDAAGGPLMCIHACLGTAGDVRRGGRAAIGAEEIRAIALAGGVIGVGARSTEGRGVRLDAARWAADLARAAELAGTAQVALGAGLGRRRASGSATEAGEVERLVSALLAAGFDDADLCRVLGGNWLRLFRQVWGG